MVLLRDAVTSAGRSCRGITAGAHVQVLEGVQFPEFRFGDEGIVLSVDASTQLCQVEFSVGAASVQVPLRHLGCSGADFAVDEPLHRASSSAVSTTPRCVIRSPPTRTPSPRRRPSSGSATTQVMSPGQRCAAAALKEMLLLVSPPQAASNLPRALPATSGRRVISPSPSSLSRQHFALHSSASPAVPRHIRSPSPACRRVISPSAGSFGQQHFELPGSGSQQQQQTNNNNSNNLIRSPIDAVWSAESSRANHLVTGGHEPLEHSRLTRGLWGVHLTPVTPSLSPMTQHHHHQQQQQQQQSLPVSPYPVLHLHLGHQAPPVGHQALLAWPLAQQQPRQSWPPAANCSGHPGLPPPGNLLGSISSLPCIV
ncbi:unnamed protein product [Polarella glacialis]|uniref:Uncharacterized protein n=1 Tax=Polarella glacialis TaxID=89957 RepID=A0A813E0I6_POLGL|nr:unnamed protein product [Polarella glacialis]CAE8650384.1 unnamed protein product [Polarella glacialis]